MKNQFLTVPLTMAGFYYRGVDVILNQKICKDLEGLIERFDKALPGYERDIAQEGPEFYIDQLEQLITEQLKEGGFTWENAILWCMNIHILTKLGHIQNDEFNGTQFIYSEI
jgi:hypothetical protein